MSHGDSILKWLIGVTKVPLKMEAGEELVLQVHVAPFFSTTPPPPPRILADVSPKCPLSWVSGAAG